MAEWRVQRLNATATPPRFEWLRNRPDFVAGDPAATPPTEDSVVTRWTWRDAGDPTGWRNGQLPHDFGRDKARRWVALIDGEDVRVVHTEDAPADENVDFVALAQEALKAARRAYREALAAGTEQPL
jgi:hypothetical protein